MLILLLQSLKVFSYQETLTLVPIDSLSTLSILNFSDHFQIQNPSTFTDLKSFPLPIYQLLHYSSRFSASLTWGIPDLAIPRLLDYSRSTSRVISPNQPGFSLFVSTNTYQSFTQKLSSLLGTGVITQDPIRANGQYYSHSNDYLCIENFRKIEAFLPCKQKGLVGLFDQLMTSKYLSLEVRGEIEDGEYRYEVIVTALKKEQLVGGIGECGASIEVFEKSLERYPSSIKLSKLALSPVKAEKTPKISSRRLLRDDEHGFTAEFEHKIKNLSGNSLKITVIETFPRPATPLLSSLSHKVTRILKKPQSWVLEFDLTLPPGELTIKLTLDKQLLGFEEYPSDPQRGWDIHPGLILLESSSTPTNGLLIMIPEPDFSMPFNVICITGTVMAFFLTSLQSLQTWKDAVHWSNANYETRVVKAKKLLNILKNAVLIISLAIMITLDQLGIIKMFG